MYILNNNIHRESMFDMSPANRSREVSSFAFTSFVFARFGDRVSRSRYVCSSFNVCMYPCWVLFADVLIKGNELKAVPQTRVHNNARQPSNGINIACSMKL